MRTPLIVFFFKVLSSLGSIHIELCRYTFRLYNVKIHVCSTLTDSVQKEQKEEIKEPNLTTIVDQVLGKKCYYAFPSASVDISVAVQVYNMLYSV